MKKIKWHAEKNFFSDYHDGVKISTTDPHYGPLAPGEKKLKLLGNRKSLKGKKALEVGCGAAENCIALAKWGAECTGIDISEEAIEEARKLAKKEGVKINLILGDATNLLEILPEKECFDIVISSYGITLIYGINSLFSQIALCLKRNGKFVFCGRHPCQNYPKINSLWVPEHKPIGWDENCFPINQMARFLTKNGFLIERIVEQTTKNPSQLSKKEKEKYPYQVLKLDLNLDKFTDKPHTIIYSCRLI